MTLAKGVSGCKSQASQGKFPFRGTTHTTDCTSEVGGSSWVWQWGQGNERTADEGAALPPTWEVSFAPLGSHASAKGVSHS